MAFGFGFNKAKVLASAEKSVKSGKLQNAIADYEKIVKEDPKDLTVLNTIGDLYARVGNPEQATAYFKRVGDAYASDGFTVKAIAMYKKLTKQNPNATDAILKLGELYTQQGLYNDARMQYMQIADAHLRNNELDKAALVFQRMLELDPDNQAMQGRVAELYVRLNRKAEARDLYFRSAQTLHGKGALDACDDALEHVISLDPGFSQAILLRGKVRLQAEDPEGAVQYLETLPDIDSRPDALQLLLTAFLQLGKVTEAEPIARKILNVFNDPSGITALADKLMSNGACEDALRLYREHADRLLATNSPALMEALHNSIGKVKESSRALETLREIFSKAGNTSHLAEVMELLAHAYVHDGALTSARDLYQKLSELEPQNPLHAQNYKQIMAKLGQDAVGRPLSAEEGAQAFMVDELEPTVQLLEQPHPPEVAEAIKAALTEAELFDSYNLPVRAIPGLEGVLPSAPRDAQLNQRLASLYARVGRMADAADRCLVLEKIYSEAGHGQQAQEYANMAARYRRNVGPATAGTAAEEPPSPRAMVMDLPGAAPAAPPPQPDTVTAAQFGPDEVPFGADAFGDFVPTPPPPPPPVAGPPQPPTPVQPAAYRPGAPVPFPVTASSLTPPVAAAPAEMELELGTVSQAGAPSEQPSIAEFTFEADPSHFRDFDSEHISLDGSPAPAPVMPQAPPPLAPPSPAPVERVGSHEIDLSEEWDRMLTVEPAATGTGSLETSETASDGSSTVAWELPEQPPEQPAEQPVEQSAAMQHSVVADLTDEIRFYLAQSMWEEARSALNHALTVAPGAPEITELRDQLVASEPAAATPTEAPLADATAWPPPEPVLSDSVAGTAGQGTVAAFEFESSGIAQEHAEAEVEAAAPVSLPEKETAQPVAASPPIAIPEPQPEVLAASAQVFASETAPAPEMVPAFDVAAAADAAASPEAIAAGPETLAEKPPAPAHEALGDFVLDLEQSLGDDFELAAAAPAPATPPTSPPPVMAAAPVHAVPPPASKAPAVPPSAITLTPEAEVMPDSALTDLFAEFKEDMEQGSGTAEDPETHYNLGVAFKEMGLLDEAIGELQKVCQAIEHGHPFSQTIEAYTWLADCFVQKGVPEAGVRWYQKSLQAPGVDDEKATAIHYELACAYEAAGDRSAALKHFMDVYGTNIDYRDVAERIKALKS